MQDHHLLVYITAPAEEAAPLCETLVRERLAACANILDGARSLYWWDGAVRNAVESVCVLKTMSSRYEALQARVRELHSYTTPCIVALPLCAGDADFLAWVRKETTPSAL